MKHCTSYQTSYWRKSSMKHLFPHTQSPLTLPFLSSLIYITTSMTKRKARDFPSLLFLTSNSINGSHICTEHNFTHFYKHITCHDWEYLTSRRYLLQFWSKRCSFWTHFQVKTKHRQPRYGFHYSVNSKPLQDNQNRKHNYEISFAISIIFHFIWEGCSLAQMTKHPSRVTTSPREAMTTKSAASTTYVTFDNLNAETC